MTVRAMTARYPGIAHMTPHDTAWDEIHWLVHAAGEYKLGCADVAPEQGQKQALECMLGS